jgi:hypothetical protein
VPCLGKTDLPHFKERSIFLSFSPYPSFAQKSMGSIKKQYHKGPLSAHWQVLYPCSFFPSENPHSFRLRARLFSLKSGLRDRLV